MILNKYIITPYVILNIIVNLLLLFDSYGLFEKYTNECTHEYNVPLGYSNYSNTSYYCPVDLNNNNHNHNIPLGYFNYSNTSYYCPIHMNQSSTYNVFIPKFNHSYSNSIIPFYNTYNDHISNKMVPYNLYRLGSKQYVVHYQFYFTLYCFCFVFYMGLV